MQNSKVVKSAIPAVVMLSLALGLRQMSMTLVMPFISIYCKSLYGYTSVLAGIAIGIFGLMQAVFQIPFGMLSDRFGNKKIMLIGLSSVVAGLVLAYFAKSMVVLIAARSLQGCGAVIGVGYSWAAGIAGEKDRTRAMSILGAFISAAAALAFAAGPLLREFMSVNQMFLTCAVLIFFNELYILFFIKDHKNISDTSNAKPNKRSIMKLLKDKNFIIMNLSAFLNNCMMISVFFAVPIYLSKVTGDTGMWKAFVPSIIIAVVFMKAAVRFTQKGLNKQILMFSFLISSLSMLFYFNKNSFTFLLTGTAVFMCGYITLAAITAANVNETVSDAYRGTANGIFNSFQYVGNFVGALIAGALWNISEGLTWLVTIGIGLLGFLLVTYGVSAKNKKMDTENVK